MSAFICLVFVSWNRCMFQFFATKWQIHCAYAIRQLSRSAVYSYDFHRCCSTNVCIRPNSRTGLICSVSSRTRFAVRVQYSTAVQKILCAEMTDFLPEPQTYILLVFVQGVAVKDHRGGWWHKKDVAVLKISPLDCSQNHFFVASRKQVTWEGQEVMCRASALDC